MTLFLPFYIPVCACVCKFIATCLKYTVIPATRAWGKHIKVIWLQQKSVTVVLICVGTAYLEPQHWTKPFARTCRDLFWKYLDTANQDHNPPLLTTTHVPTLFFPFFFGLISLANGNFLGRTVVEGIVAVTKRNGGENPVSGRLFSSFLFLTACCFTV